MRRIVAVLTGVGLFAPALVMMPTVTSGAAPRPVATEVAHVALAGVDAAALRAQGEASDAAISADRVSAASTTERSTLVVLTAPRSAASFQTVGVSWTPVPAGPRVEVALRTHTGGRWTAWSALDQEEDPSDQQATRSGTEPLFAGASDGVQARVEVTGAVPQDLRLDLVNPGDSSYDATAGRAPAGSASAAATKPPILTRAAWGADESRRRGTPTVMSTIKAGVLHHTAGINGYSQAQVPKILRGDYAYHLSRGWNDIGYNFLVDRFGRTWEGRYGGIDAAVMGAHAGGFNTDTFGVSMIGNYDETRPTAAAVEAVARLFAWKLDLYHRNPRGTTQLTSAGGGTAKYPAGRTVTLPVVMGHRNVGSTACPGKYLYAQLGGIRARVAVLMKAALLDPRTSAATVPQASGTAAIAATALTTQTWKLRVTRPCAGNVVVASSAGSVKAGKRFGAVWNGLDASGRRARAGAYVLTLTSQSKAGSARPLTSTVLLVPPASGAEPQGDTTVGDAGSFVPLAPTRLLDTRSAAPIGPAGRTEVRVLGRGGVPASGVTSVVLNVATICPTGGTYLSTWATGRTGGGAVTTNARKDVNSSELVTVPVGAGGTISLRNAAGVTDAIVDVVGYHSATGGSGLRVTAPQRVYDSRKGAGLSRAVPRIVTLPEIAGVAAADVTGVVADVTVYGPSGSGYLTAAAPGVTATGSTMNFTKGQDVDGRAFIGVRNGQLSLTSSVNAHVAVDVVGVFTASGAKYTAIPVKRALDTRTSGKLSAGTGRTVTVTGGGVPAGADAVLVNLVGITPSAKTTIVAFAGDRAKGTGYDLRLVAGDTRANTALVPVAADGTIAVANGAGTTHLVIDVLGYYAE